MPSSERNSLSKDHRGNIFSEAPGKWICSRTDYFKYSAKNMCLTSTDDSGAVKFDNSVTSATGKLDVSS